MIVKLAIRNILHKPLNFLLGWLLLTVSVGIISLLLLVQDQIERQFSNNIDGIDMVLGAKGSPLQLILSAVYHLDAPTGNIKYADAEKWMHHPFVEKAIPLAYGDSYRGYPVVGTTPDYLDKYKAVLQQGKLYDKDYEVVVGDGLAKLLSLKVGDQFFGTHGDKEGGEQHKEHAYHVTGILKPSEFITDKLIIGNIESVWKMHEGHHHDGDAADEEEEDEKDTAAHHTKNTNDGAKIMGVKETTAHHEAAGKELTAVLLKFRNPMAQIQFPRMINTNTNMMAAVPAIEINRLFSLLGVGIDTLQKMGWGIMALSALSVFITLFNALKDRKYELALMRTMGGRRLGLVTLVLVEALMLCISGFVFGIVLSRLALWFFSRATESNYHFSLHEFGFVWQRDGYLLFFTLLIGGVAALIPAIKAYRLNISKTLANG